LFLDQRRINLEYARHPDAACVLHRGVAEQGITLVDQVKRATRFQHAAEALIGGDCRPPPAQRISFGQDRKLTHGHGAQFRGRLAAGSTGVKRHLSAPAQQGMKELLDMNRTSLGTEDRHPRVGAYVSYAHRLRSPAKGCSVLSLLSD